MAEFFMSLPLGITCIFLGTFFFTTIIYFLFFTVLAAVLKFFAVGAPFAPAFFMVSPDPAKILFFFAWIFLYRLKITPYHFVREAQ